MGRPKRKICGKSLVDETKDHMKNMKTYRLEFDKIIEIYCDLLDQYDTLNEQYKRDKMPFEEKTRDGSKKAPIVITLESLRKDIATYATQLGLTPAGLKRINEDASKPPKKTSALESVMKSLAQI